MIEVLRRSRNGLVAVGLALVVTSILIVIAGAQPFEAFQALWDGSFGSDNKLADTLMAWVPLVLAAAGLIVTFQAGMWNIGVEGQIIMGAIAASWAAREVPGPSWVVIPIIIVAGLVGGALYALIPGYLRTQFNVNEIFSGVALFFLAGSLAVYLIIGPWSRSGVASTSGTDIFRPETHLPTVGNLRVAPIAIGLALLGVIFVYALMRGTRYGLRLKAVGRNPDSAALMGIPTKRYFLSSFLICGALAGLAGVVQAIGFHHKLVPSISGGYGFLGILVVLLAAFRASWIAPIALFFAAIQVGSTQLPLRLDIDSDLAGIIQGILVLFILLVGGFQIRRLLKQGEKPVVPSLPGEPS